MLLYVVYVVCGVWCVVCVWRVVCGVWYGMCWMCCVVCGICCMWCVLYMVCVACGVCCMWCVLYVVCVVIDKHEQKLNEIMSGEKYFAKWKTFYEFEAFLTSITMHITLKSTKTLSDY